MRRVIWSAEARDNLSAIRDHIGQFNPVAAERLALRLVEVAESLDEFSDRGPPIGGGRRELTIVRPYIVRYRVTADAVVILRIRHGARRPD